MCSFRPGRCRFREFYLFIYFYSCASPAAVLLPRLTPLFSNTKGVQHVARAPLTTTTQPPSRRQPFHVSVFSFVSHTRFLRKLSIGSPLQSCVCVCLCVCACSCVSVKLLENSNRSTARLLTPPPTHLHIHKRGAGRRLSTKDSLWHGANNLHPAV